MECQSPFAEREIPPVEILFRSMEKFRKPQMYVHYLILHSPD